MALPLYTRTRKVAIRRPPKAPITLKKPPVDDDCCSVCGSSGSPPPLLPPFADRFSDLPSPIRRELQEAAEAVVRRRVEQATDEVWRLWIDRGEGRLLGSAIEWLADEVEVAGRIVGAEEKVGLEATVGEWRRAKWVREALEAVEARKRCKLSYSTSQPSLDSYCYH